jgi:thiol-disulfide isomerase/thioredoxin
MNLKILFPVVVVALLIGCVGDQSRLQVGTKVPSLRTKTLNDVGGDLAKITTYRYPDERMYQLSLDEALKSGKPVVLEFATPAHCTVCDNQLNMLKALLDKYQDQVLFLHMDQYQNAVAFRTYQILGDPWTFVIDNGNVVRFKRPGRMLYQELDAVIAGVLQVSTPVNADAS